MKFQIILFFFGLISTSLIAQNALEEGLFFSSHEVRQEDRTSLNLTPNESIEVKSKFVIEFDANFRHGDGYYGNILQLIGNDNFNIDLVANLNNSSETFWIAVKDELALRFKWSDIPKGDFDKWIKFQLTFDIESSELTLSINGYKKSSTLEVVNSIEDIDVVFGKNNFKKFRSTDVCPMSVKGIKILNSKSNLIRYWPLGKHTKGNNVYDEIENDVAIVENPKWLIDQHVFWLKNRDFDFDGLIGTTINKINNQVYFILPELLHVYDITSQSLKTIHYANDKLICESLSFVYNNLTNELFAYSINENVYKTFSFENRTWSSEGKECDETAYHHHNSFISPKDSSVVTFGGYGFYKYKSEINNFKKNTSELSTIDIKKNIEPRYLSSSGILNNDSFLIYGGYGSPSGKQGVGSQVFNDLYKVKFDEFSAKNLWRMEKDLTKPLVPVSNMIIDESNDSFYTLIFDNTNYNTHLQLSKYKISEFKQSIYPDSIPYQFLDIKSNVEFFLNSDKSKLNAITIFEDKANLYTLSYPPLMSEDIYQEEIPLKSSNSKLLWLIPLIIIILLVIFLILKNKGLLKKKVIYEDKAEEQTFIPVKEEIETIKKSAIYLFGGFQVYDKNEEDITAQFTPTLKQLFLIILLASAKNRKGISSNKLTDLLWPNKSETKARNNRNVNISKLRLLLEKIGDNIDLNNKNTYWKIKLGPDVFCDYIFVQDTLIESGVHPLEKDQINNLLNIISSGEISPDVQTEWIEDYKEEAVSSLLDDLLRIAQRQDDPHVLVQISNIVLKYAPLNEDAIQLKCKSLYKLGRKGSAKQSYDEFCQTYEKILDAPFDKSFKELISTGT